MISILFQKESMGHGGHFKILKIFHYHLLKKCFKKAVEALKVWASKGITAAWKFSKCFLEPKTSLKHLNIVSEGKYGTCRPFSVLRIFQCHLLKKYFRKAVETFKVCAPKGITAERKFLNCVLRANRAQKHVKIVSECDYELFWTFWKN